MTETADIIVIGAGIAGLAAAAEAAEAGRRVLVLDQEGPQDLGGQAWWSLGGMFMVDTPEQRLMGVRDGRDLAAQDWMGSARFDRPEDDWPRRWAEAYLDFASGEMRPWLAQQGVRWLKVVGWAERGGALADGHGNSVPRFHIPWGTGRGAMEPFRRRCAEQQEAGRLSYRFRHRVTELAPTGAGGATVRGDIMRDDDNARGAPSNRDFIGDFELSAGAVILASGGGGGDPSQVLKHWPVERLGPAPRGEDMVMGVPAYVDGQMIDAAERAGLATANRDRMWHYCEGLRNWAPVWRGHGIRILPGPSPMWFDAFGNRLAAPDLPGFDTLSTLETICRSGRHYSWFICTQTILRREFALSGSEQNMDMTEGGMMDLLRARVLPRRDAHPAVEAFKRHGPDFVIADDLETLIARMNALEGVEPLDPARIRSQIEARDAQLANPFCKDAQVMAIRQMRAYRGDRLMRTAKPHRILDPAHGPLVGVKLNLLTRKSLGGLRTDLSARALDASGEALPGIYAAGECAGFGGGGYHGYSALEGTFIGGSIFSGRTAGRAAADQ